jgi:outer membrane receptor protein involved in Fe transport
MDVPGVFVQQTNYAGGSPIIRGLAGKQVLILIDGVRVNNATYRFGFVQYLSTIDVAAVERIEIVRGAESVLTSDSLGGVINIVMRKGPSAADHVGLGAAVSSRFSTADEGLTGRGEVFGRTERVRFGAGGSWRSSSDVRAGGGVGSQAATGYDEKAADAHFAFYPSADKAIALDYNALEQTDVPRTDRIADGTNLVFDFDPQRFQLLTLSYQDLQRRWWSSGLKLNLYWNRQDEDRREIRTANPNVERLLDDHQTVLGANLEGSSIVFGSHRLVWGTDYTAESIGSSRLDRNLLTLVTAPKRGNYTDGATYNSVAFYVQDRFALGSRLDLAFGVRHAEYWADGQEQVSGVPLDLDSHFGGTTGVASAIVKPDPRLHLIVNVTRGFRAPNLDDLSIYDERPEGTEVPNPGVDPERSLSFETGLKYQDRRFEASAFYYRNDLQDLLVRAQGSFLGQPFIDVNGNGARDTKEPLALQKQNIGEANLSGIEADLTLAAGGGVVLFANATRTVGDDERLGEPLPRIPPLFGAAGARWRAGTAWRPWAELVYRFARSQHRLSSIDRSDVRVGANGTDGFNVFDLRGGVSLGARLRVTAALENLFDQRYKYHGSGVLRPGFQAVLGAEYRF